MSVFGIFMVRIQSKCGKMWNIKTLNTDTFHAVLQCTDCYSTVNKFLLSDMFSQILCVVCSKN